ncbi:hypothetical protein [Caenibacillus caldisaponilyticus]|uniref:hypothetical protein n=1 Tax=Caenibacillus caldisaponilyticus TaxID=1674942 RepID=UPI0011773A8A|nr:hypothetical protein [Caenibacillus caldisaponilyticus]
MVERSGCVRGRNYHDFFGCLLIPLGMVLIYAEINHLKKELDVKSFWDKLFFIIFGEELGKLGLVCILLGLVMILVNQK